MVARTFCSKLRLSAATTSASRATAALSAFVQVIGYSGAGLGPLLFGVLYGATGSWVLPLAVLWVTLVAAAICGWFACAHRYVDDELAAA